MRLIAYYCVDHLTSVLNVCFHRAIERIYKEHCEQNSKEQPEYLNPSDELVWTDSTVWTKVLNK